MVPNKAALKSLEGELNDIKATIKETSDPIDKIAVLADFIKRIIESQGVREVILASPFGPDFHWEEYADGENYCEETMADCIKAYEAKDPDYRWYEPYWLCYEQPFRDTDCLTIFDRLNITTIIRLGIIDGEVKFTKQDLLQREIDDIPGMPDPNYDEQLCPESEWLKLANIPDPNRWYMIAQALLLKPIIWEYTQTYPQLHRLK